MNQITIECCTLSESLTPRGGKLAYELSAGTEYRSPSTGDITSDAAAFQARAIIEMILQKKMLHVKLLY
ncbi:hypothetical protein PUN28_016207 [Cardiocondyla obscurior]|uniref:Uncharacterized protein n=1 Tax=Cardiocondyla obscurior TaxID=286306 RepID=A0AAW2EV16_9HYME